MSTHRIVCLANSYKHDQRCVAGIDLTSKHWLRLVGRKVRGCLTREEACYPDGREVGLLDVFGVELGDKCGSKSHPEDVFVSDKRWSYFRRFDDDSGRQFLEALAGTGPTVLNGYCDRVSIRRIEAEGTRCSLGLIRPNDLWWWIRLEKGKGRNRAVFRLGECGRIRYDLPVTDPAWLDQMNLLPQGIYPHTVLSGSDKMTYLTVSLSESFEGFH